MNKIEVENKYVFLIQLSPEERAAENRIQLTVRMCKKTYYGDDYDTIWFKRPFFFSGKNLKGIDIYKRILKYLYNDTYDNSKKRSRIMGGKTLEEYMKIMLNEKPFELVFKYKKSVEHYYHRKELKFDKEITIKEDTNVSELLSETTLEDVEIDARFSRDGYKDFSFERLKKYDDCTEKHSYK